MRTKWWLASVIVIFLAGCQVERQPPLQDLFPARVGVYVREQGPSPDPGTGVEQATYQGPDGEIVLRVKRVGKEQVAHALSQLPPTATDVRSDAALGQRNGKFFAFGGQFHAAWGNGDWIFILSAPADAGRSSFIAAYGY